MEELSSLAEEWTTKAGLDSSSVPVAILLIALSLTATAVLSIVRRNTPAVALLDVSTVEVSIMSQFSELDRSAISRGIHAATTANDLFALFDTHSIFESLSLPLLPVATMHDVQSLEQTFRDLVREKVILNDTCIHFEENVRDNSVKFRLHLEEYLCNALQKHTSRALPCDKLLHTVRLLCSHLSRTRAGGDTYFALQEIFEDSPFVITASPHHTHPLTSITIIEDIATVTITSNFDMYWGRQLHDHNDNPDESEHAPEAIVTISAVTVETIRLSILTPISSSWGLLSPLSSEVIPLRRDLQVSCFHPSSMWDVAFDENLRSHSNTSSPSTTIGESSGGKISPRTNSSPPLDACVHRNNNSFTDAIALSSLTSLFGLSPKNTE